jgi:pyochelin biosynthetic protein PchC
VNAGTPPRRPAEGRSVHLSPHTGTEPAVGGDDSEQARWIRRFHPSDGCRIRLVCFPPAGGPASFYFPVSQAIGPTIEVLSIQYPGRQDRRFEPCLNDIGQFADRVYDILHSVLDGPPFALFGHGMGALIAYEVAHRLESRAAVTPVGLFAAGHPAPSRRRPAHVHRLSDSGIVAVLHRLHGTTSEALRDQDMLRMILPAVRSDYRAVETYTHADRTPLSCPVSVLVGEADPTTTISEAYAWRSHTRGACEIQLFPGGHFFVNDHSTDVVNLISDFLLPALADTDP